MVELDDELEESHNMEVKCFLNTDLLPFGVIKV